MRFAKYSYESFLLHPWNKLEINKANYTKSAIFIWIINAYHIATQILGFDWLLIDWETALLNAIVLGHVQFAYNSSNFFHTW